MYKLSENVMTMDEKDWARHANPWSVYTRFTALPLLALSVWSRWWLGWDALYPLALTIFWIWLNPRLFPAPKSIDNWASKGVMGEQLFLRRRKLLLPLPRVNYAHAYTLVTILGVTFMMYGLWKFNLPFTLSGMIAAMLSKTLFLHQMVKLYETVQNKKSQSD
ncbi:MAG: hypothetical protein HWE30_01060 [Methylocystaceae bacterium]|nr:hypothetical protein [Methylocystaceae bacterium]